MTDNPPEVRCLFDPLLHTPGSCPTNKAVVFWQQQAASPAFQTQIRDHEHPWKLSSHSSIPRWWKENSFSLSIWWLGCHDRNEYRVNQFSLKTGSFRSNYLSDLMLSHCDPPPLPLPVGLFVEGLCVCFWDGGWGWGVEGGGAIHSFDGCFRMAATDSLLLWL